MTPPNPHGPTGADLPGVAWRKSTHSNGNGGSCVEIAVVGGSHLARDSKNPDGAVLVFDRATWKRFLDQVRSNEHGPA